MLLQIHKFKWENQYRYRHDEHYSAKDRWVLQRCVKYTITAFAVDEQTLTTPASVLLSNIRVRQPASDYLNYWRAPSLIAAPDTLYTRAGDIYGSDYEDLDSVVYEWRVTDAYHLKSDIDQITHTVFEITGQWDKYQGVVHSVLRRER